MQEKRLVVAYCRVSTLDQKKNGNGIEIQVRDVTLFAQGLFIDRFYRDEGKSGADERRSGLKRLPRDCRAQVIGTVILPSLDRLSRNVRLAENFFWQFERLGVQVFIADMPGYDGQDRKDVLIRQIREAIAEENRKDIIERLWKGRQERVRKGQAPGGTIPYGYRRAGKTIQPDPDEVGIVQTVFALAGAGQSSSVISGTLNNERAKRRNGRAWTARQVLAILGRRALYERGVVRYGTSSGINEKLILLSP